MNTLKFRDNYYGNIKLSIKNRLREIDSYRKSLLKPIELYLFKLLSNKKYTNKNLTVPKEVKKVLVVRNNIRIGNMFFLLPFVNEVKNTYPNAKIDLLLTDSWQGSIFENLNINKIHYSNFRFKSIIKFFYNIYKLRQTKYDVILVPYSGSSDLFVSSFLDAKNTISFSSERTDLLFSHTFKKTSNFKHYALKPLELLRHINKSTPLNINPSMNFTNDEIINGKLDFKNLIGENRKKINIAIFRGARGNKVIDNSSWENIIKKLKYYYNNDINIIEILSDDIPNKLSSIHLSYDNKNLRELASFLKNVDFFICADTGPLHLANASDVKTIGLFKKTKISAYGALGKNSINITDIKNFNPNISLGRKEIKYLKEAM